MKRSEECEGEGRAGGNDEMQQRERKGETKFFKKVRTERKTNEERRREKRRGEGRVGERGREEE